MTFYTFSYTICKKGGEITKMKIEDKLKEEIKKKYKSVRNFSEVYNIPYSTVNNIFQRSLGGASLETVRKICNALAIDIDALSYDKIAYTGDKPTVEDSSVTDLTESETQLVSNYRILDDIDKSKIDERVETLLEHEKYAVKKELLNA